MRGDKAVYVVDLAATTFDPVLQYRRFRRWGYEAGQELVEKSLYNAIGRAHLQAPLPDEPDLARARGITPVGLARDLILGNGADRRIARPLVSKCSIGGNFRLGQKPHTPNVLRRMTLAAGRMRVSFTQYGEVAVLNRSGHVYLVTNRHGQHRLITVSRPMISGEMYGVIATLMAGRGSQLTPIAAPIAFLPVKNVPDAAYGRIATTDPRGALYREHLQRVSGEQFAMFLP